MARTLPMTANLAAAIVLATIGGVARADEPKPPDDAPQTGAFRITLTERSPLSSIDELLQRYQWGGLRNPKETYEYEPADEAFDVVVPRSYDGSASYGLLVWINPGPGGAPPKDWIKPLADRGLLWIGSTDSGNDRQPVAQRIMLAIDAVGEMKRRYRIDESRVYVAGLSGGGRMASQAAMAFPDVFTGAMPIVGVDYFRQVPVPDTQHQYRAFARPAPALLRKLLTESRLVLVTGEQDFNKPQTQVVYKAMVADRFRHVSYLEQPGLGHAMPSAEWFDKGLALLDEPLVRVTREHFADGERLEHLGRYGKAVEAYEAAAQSGGANRGVSGEAGRKAGELRKRLADAVGEIEAKLAAGQTEGVAAELQKLKDSWSPLADDAAARLMERIKR